MTRDDILALITLIFVVVFSGLGIYLHRPPEAQRDDAPLTEFSALRAMSELRKIAGQPHPIGSPANLGVRDYLMRRLSILGAEPELQRTTVVQGWRVVDVENVVARLPGTSSSKALLLVAHYDSVPMSPGAGDAGSAVAALLETLRAVTASGPLRNDVIFLFTNPEEVFLHGGKAFVDEHPWMQDVGLVLNMDPGGVSGPAYLHGTSDQNGWLVNEFAAAVPHPMGSSLASGVKKLMGDRNDEFHLFTEARVPGYNASFIEGDAYYHTRLDHPDHLDPRSLQHLGEYALSLVRHFGHGPLVDRREENAVYFNSVGSLFIHYPEAYVLPMTVGVLVLCVVVWALGVLTARLTLRGIFLGVLVFVAAVLLAPLAVLGVWWVLKTELGVYDGFLTGDVYDAQLYLLGLVLVAVAVASAVYALFFRRTSMENLAFGALLGWTALVVASALYLPGGSYLFLWPLFFSLLAMAFFFPRKPGAEGRELGAVVLLVGSIPALILVSTHLRTAFVALSMDEAPYLMALPALLLGLLVPHLSFTMEVRRWLVPGLTLVGAAVVFGLLLSSGGFDQHRPRPNFIVYGLDADDGEAVWATRYRAVELEEPDSWTGQFFPGDYRSGPLEFFPWSSSSFLQGEASIGELAPPTAELLEETTGPNGRTLRLRVRSPRRASILIGVTDRQVRSLSVGERLVDHHQLLAYWAFPQEGFELTVETGDTAPLTLTLIDESYGLPELPGVTIVPRPADMMQEPSGGLIFSDATLVRKSYSF